MDFVWIICVAVMGGFTAAEEKICNNTFAETCYSDLVNYESVAFPLYGSDKAELDDTCGNINMSLECIDSYSRRCFENPSCDQDCQELIRYIHVFLANSGLPSIGQDLCSNDINPLKDVYLANYPCLKQNEAEYAKCHALSKRSQKYLDTLTGPEAVHGRCCYFSWYFGCFENTTRDNCSKNATFFVGFSLHKLVGHIREQLCADFAGSCSEGPPLPVPTQHEDGDNDGEDGDSELTTQDEQALGHSGTVAAMTCVKAVSLMMIPVFLVGVSFVNTF